MSDLMHAVSPTREYGDLFSCFATGIHIAPARKRGWIGAPAR